jgi:hypothetical protein
VESDQEGAVPLTNAQRDEALAAAIDALHRFREDAGQAMRAMGHGSSPGDPLDPADFLPTVYVPRLHAQATILSQCLKNVGFEFNLRPLTEFIREVSRWHVDRARRAWEAVDRLLREIEARVAVARAPAGWAIDHLIVDTLRAVGHRLTTSQLLSEMVKRGERPSESTVKKRLAAMVTDGRLTNDQKARPKGYGLPEWTSSPGS